MMSSKIKEAYMNPSLSPSHHDSAEKSAGAPDYEERNPFKDYLETLFPEDIVFRCRITKQSKGLISSRTLANYDSSSEQTGVPGRFFLNGKTCYHRDSLIAWLLKRIKPTGIRGSKNRADRFLEDTARIKSAS